MQESFLVFVATSTSVFLERFFGGPPLYSHAEQHLCQKGECRKAAVEKVFVVETDPAADSAWTKFVTAGRARENVLIRIGFYGCQLT